MTTQITWSVEALDCAVSEDGLSNVVKVVHWRCTGVDSTYTGTVYSTCSLPAPTPEAPFTPYPDLTKNQVLGWIWANGVDKTATENAVVTQIDLQKHPVVVTPPLPWNPATAAQLQ